MGIFLAVGRSKGDQPGTFDGAVEGGVSPPHVKIKLMKFGIQIPGKMEFVPVSACTSLGSVSGRVWIRLDDARDFIEDVAADALDKVEDLADESRDYIDEELPGWVGSLLHEVKLQAIGLEDLVIGGAERGCRLFLRR